MGLKTSDIEALIRIFDDSDWEEMHLEIGGEEIFLSKDASARGPSGAVAPAALPPSAGVPVAPAPESRAPAGPVDAGASADTPADARPQEGWVAVTATNLGTFYKAPEPGAAPYVSVGDRVTPETEVCLIEVMKLFTTMRAGVAGTVREVCVEDAQMVEYGQTLMWIEPD
ncbi:MAG: acetyl-CoA carboxylase biotin carboxyl carrier protein [Rhodosalinus sp.]